MANDEVMKSLLINQMWLIREYNNFHKGALNKINKIDSLIRVEINQQQLEITPWLINDEL